MCRFKSGIILKSKAIVAPGADDSHTTLLESLGIEDTLWNAQRVFVRAELAPENNEWWASPREQPEKWSFVVDQDVVPEWFDKTEQETIFREYVCDWWDKHVLVDKQVEKLSAGFYRLRQCVVKRLCNDVLVLLNNSQVGKMCGNSQVWGMYDYSQVDGMYGSSWVGGMCGSSEVGKMYDNSTARDFKRYPHIRIVVPDSENFEIVTNTRR